MHLSRGVVAETANSWTTEGGIRNWLPLMIFFSSILQLRAKMKQNWYIPAMKYTVVYMQLILLLVVTVQKESLSKK